jgi:hypothetical protein
MKAIYKQVALTGAGLGVFSTFEPKLEVTILDWVGQKEGTTWMYVVRFALYGVVGGTICAVASKIAH